ncbi:MAG: 50S ribosomal protein L24 [Gemmatimonadetes bacterium]|nr:50S ribosomal protein L24 [Gemmatimonadota bacterium]
MTRNRLNVRTGDTVRVIAGNYSGATGQVLRTIPAKGQVVVADVNMRKHHRRPTQRDPEGGIMTFEAPIRASNVMLVCPHCDEPTRVSRRHDEDGTIERICKRCDNPIPTAG